MIVPSSSNSSPVCPLGECDELGLQVGDVVTERVCIRNLSYKGRGTWWEAPSASGSASNHTGIDAVIRVGVRCGHDDISYALTCPIM